LDFDGVITRLEIDWDYVRAKASEAIGVRIESLNTFWGETFGTSLFRRVSALVEEYELQAVSKSRAYEDVKPALESFDGPIYLASMQSEKAINVFLNRHFLRRFFKEVLGREHFGSKGRQLLYIRGVEGEGDEIFLVDDSRRNVETCEKLGIRCILLDRKAGDNLASALQKG
jgi:phosphoglycolate phosphatase-like HAD superfamily hydrolase